MNLNKLNLLKEGKFAKIYTKGEVAYKVAELSGRELLHGQFELLSEIKDPHFVSVYDWFEDKDKCGFSMEKIPLLAIDHVFKKTPAKKEDFEKIKSILLSILDALWVLHSKGIICGDLKPTHIFVDKNNNVKLIDPGYDPDIITPAYSAPEALTDSPTFSSDIYSIGIILYEILTGEKAFKGNLSETIESKLKKRLPPPEEKNPAIPEELNLLLLRMIEPEPGNRLKSIQDVKRELALGTPAQDGKSSFVSVFANREREFKEFDSSIEKLPDSRIFLIKGEKGIGKTALLKQFKIRALSRRINAKEITIGELYSISEKKKEITEPLVLLLDNIQSLSELSGILKENEITIRANPVIITISTDDKKNDIKELQDITTTFLLSPLNKKDIEFILDKNFPQLENKKELIAFLLERTAGNPFLLNQIIEILIEEEVIERKGDKIIFKEKRISSVPLPKSIEDNLEFQIEKLHKEEKELLKTLSISHEKFPLDLIYLFEIKNPYIIINFLISKNILQKDKKGIHFANNWVREFLYKKLTKKDKENIYEKIKKEITHPEVLYNLQKDLGMRKEYRDSVIKIAKKKIKEKEYPEGIRFLSEVLTIEENKINRMILARILEMTGNRREALYHYKKLLTDEPKNAYFLEAVGKDEHWLGYKQESRYHLEKAIQVSEGKAQEKAIATLVNILMENKELEEASRLISEFKGELTLKLKWLSAWIHFLKNEPDKSWKISKEALSKALPLHIKGLFFNLAAVSKQKKEEHKEAINYFNKCIDIAKKENDLLAEGVFRMNKSISLLSLGQYKETAEDLESSLYDLGKANLKNPEENALICLSDVYLVLGYWDKLEERIEKFKEKYGKLHPELKEKLLRCKLYRGNWGEVEKIRDELKEEKYDLKEGEGILFAYKGEWESSEKILKEVLKKTKGDPRKERDIARELSEVLYNQKKTEEAISYLKPYLKEINSIQSDFEKGKILSSWGLINQDIKPLDKAIKRFSGITLPFYTAQTRLRKAKVLIEKNKNEEAIEELKKAEEIFKELKSGLFLGKTYELFAECAKKTSLRSGYIRTYDEISKLLSSIDSEKRFDEALAILTEFFNAERGAIILKEDEKNIIISSYNIDEVTLEDARKISSTITGKAAKGEVVIAGDASEDSRFLEMDSIQRNKIHSILSVPISSGEETYGVLYLDSTIKKNIFLPSDKEFLQSIGRILGILFSKGDLLYRIKEEVKQLRRMTSPPESFHSIIGISEQMQKIYKTIEEIAETDVNVLITGETGTGKELLARTVHQLSRRNNRPFVTVDCSSLTETLLQSELFGHKKGSFTGAIADKKGMCEEANGGTLFLDEIGDAPASIQAGLLRVTDLGEIRRVGETESKKVDVRIISATNRDIEQAAMLREFREDLLYRLNQINIAIPPLRERKIDISLLLEHYLKIFSEKKEKKVKGFTEDAMRILKDHPFPGNIRELKNIVEISLIRCKGKYITAEALPEEIRKEKKEESRNWEQIKTKWRKETIIEALQETGGNVKKTAENLKISRRHLYRLIKDYNIRQ